MVGIRGIPSTAPRTRRRGILHSVNLSNDRITLRKAAPLNAVIKSQARLESAAVFGWVAWAASFPCDLDAVAAYKLSQNTLYLPRDLIAKAMYGTLVQVTLADGTRMWGVRQLTTQVQALLDQISQNPGDMLLRTGDGWVALVPGANAGDVLTNQGPGLIPKWQPSSGGGGGTSALVAPPIGPWAGKDTSNNAMKALTFVPEVNMTISSVMFLHDDSLAGTYEAQIWTLPGGLTSRVLGTLLATSPAVHDTSATGWPVIHRLPFSSAVPLTAGTVYCVAIVRTDGTGSSPIDLYYSAATYTPPPMPASFQISSVLASKTPASGNTMSASGNPFAPWAVGMEWTPSP